MPRISGVRIRRREAATIEAAAGIASGHGEYALSNALWHFASQLEAGAKEIEKAQAIAVLAGEREPVEEELHEYRRLQLITRDEFLRLRQRARGRESQHAETSAIEGDGDERRGRVPGAARESGGGDDARD